MSEDNREQVEYWNGDAGQRWVEAQEWLDATLSPISSALLEKAAARPGERVVDIGCGCGDTSIALAATGADVRGVDISAPMLERAEARARSRTGGGRIVFTRADAATEHFTPDHDLVFSRFGVMFFADPRAAFSNLRAALDPGGRLCFACWQAPRVNPWVAVAVQAVRPFLPEPEEQPDPRAPGPFAFAEQDYVTAILQHAGFAGIGLESFTTDLHVAGDLDGAITFLTRLGPLARVLVELDETRRQEAIAAVRGALAPYETASGVALGSASWLVTARAG